MVNPADPHTSTISIGPEASRKRKSCEEKTRLNTSATSPANPPKASRRWSKTSFVAAKTANTVNVIGILRKNPPTKTNTKKKKTKPDTSSESPAVDAVEDALRFLFSKDGKIVRDNVVEDALDALEAFFDVFRRRRPLKRRYRYRRKRRRRKEEGKEERISRRPNHPRPTPPGVQSDPRGDRRPPGLMDPSRRQIRLRKRIRGHGVYVSFRNARARA